MLAPQETKVYAYLAVLLSSYTQTCSLKCRGVTKGRGEHGGCWPCPWSLQARGAKSLIEIFYDQKVVEVAHTRLPSVGFRSWSRCLAVILQGDVSHKPGGRLSLLSARPAVNPATLKRAATNFAAWWTEARLVWTVCLRLLPDSVAAAIWTRALLRLSPAR